MTDAQHFERQMRRDLAHFVQEKADPAAAARRRRRASENPNAKTRLVVTIVVRKKQLAADEYFVYESEKISQLEADIDARRAAKAAGWPILGWTQSIEVKED